MIRYVCKKIFISAFSVFFVITFTFFLMKLIPGNPLLVDETVPKEIIDNLYKLYGFDKPLSTQYFLYLKKLVHLDLGTSLIYHGRSTMSIIKETFPISFFIGIQALFLAFFLGTLLGSISAFYRNKWKDSFSSFLTTIAISVPSFLLATLLQYFFSMKYHIFPIARCDSYLNTVLPSLALCALPTASIARLIRTNLIDTLKKDYIKAAIAKGVKPFRLIIKHALRNAIFPVIAYIGPLCAHVIMGSFVIEKIFGIPGLGGWLIMSILNRDYPLIMGLSIFFTVLLITITFIIDVVYCIVDPRVQQMIKKRRFNEADRSF